MIPSVGERLEQALAYLATKNATSDPEWYESVSELEAYLESLQGIKRPDEDDNTGGPYAGVDCYLEDALVCGEAEEAAAAAKDKIDALEALDDLSSTVGRPPPIYGTNTRRARCEIQGLRHGTQSPGRASIPASINGKMRTQSPSLKVLLETADRQFVGCLIVDAELGRIAQAMGQLDQTVEEDSAEKDVDDALFHNDFRRLQST
ncbi:hypothetical protein SEUCBS139899_001351 [Sporothrix eucalyptigena]